MLFGSRSPYGRRSFTGMAGNRPAFGSRSPYGRRSFTGTAGNRPDRRRTGFVRGSYSGTARSRPAFGSGSPHRRRPYPGRERNRLAGRRHRCRGGSAGTHCYGTVSGRRTRCSGGSAGTHCYGTVSGRRHRCSGGSAGTHCYGTVSGRRTGVVISAGQRSGGMGYSVFSAGMGSAGMGSAGMSCFVMPAERPPCRRSRRTGTATAPAPDVPVIVPAVIAGNIYIVVIPVIDHRRRRTIFCGGGVINYKFLRRSRNRLRCRSFF